jgi:hypothetical protein
MNDRGGAHMSDDDRPDHDTIVRYVLGTLPEEEQARLEEEFFRDDACFEHVLAVEDDLLHEYAQGGLSEDERGRLVERLVRTPAGQQRLARARALLDALQEGRRTSAPRARWLPAAAAVLVAGGVGWLVAGRPSVDRAGVDPTPSPLGAGPAPNGPSPVVSTPSAASVAALALAPGLSRAEAAPRRVTLSGSVAMLRLALAVPDHGRHTDYRAVLLTAEGPQAWSGTGSRTSPGTVTVEVPAVRLAEGDYELILTATDGARRDEVASYSFGVLRE